MTPAFKKIGFAIMAIVALASVSASAAVVPLATVGPIYTGGATYGGGSIYYQFTISSTTAGVLVVKAALTPTGGKWLPKPTIPVLTNSAIVVGDNAIKSQTIAIPQGFLGNATLTLGVTLNKKPIAVKPVKLSIRPQFNFYDVGFGNSVVLNAAGIPTTGMGAHPTYTWTQIPNALGVLTSGGNLSSNTAVAPTFTTGLKALTDLVGSTTPNLAALENEQVTNSTYVYQVTVSGNKITRNGTFTVACAQQTPGTDIPVGVNALYMSGNTTSSWSLAKPTGSNATLTTLTDGINVVAQLRPDLAGNYTVTSTPTTGNATTITKYAASYHGLSACSGCHGPGGTGPDMLTPWQKTGHATMAQRGIDGLVAPYYNETCFQCHTLGYNQSAAAAGNGNFKAVANQLGWQFPSKLQAGNFAAMPAKLQNLANIQCESCHGPVFQPGGDGHGNRTVSLDVQVCASCHQDGQHHNRVAQWRNGPHADPYKGLSTSEGTNAGCARCHSPNGFQDVAKRIDSSIAQPGGNAATAQVTYGNAADLALGTGPLTCQTCHDPHDSFGNSDRHQLRIFDTVVIGDLANPGTITLNNVGASAACMICHNSRRLPLQLSSGVARYKGTRSGAISGPHESPVAEVFNGVGVMDYGVQMGNSFHTSMANCQTCHMYQLRAPDSKGVPLDKVSIGGTVTSVTTALYQDLRDLVGDHTFSVSNTYVKDGVTSEVQNVAACNQCHTEPVTTFDFKPVNAKDYDGNGIIEGVQTETQNLLDKVRLLLNATGVASTTNAAGEWSGFSSTGLSATAAIKDAQLKAAWNWMMIKRDGSRGVHNTQFTIRLLQSTWTDLNTKWTGNAANTFSAAFPNAYLR